MADKKPIRTLFCGAVLQGFFDLPSAEIMTVLKATGKMIRTIRETDGVEVIGTMDDDETMVGTSPDG
ncbi:MAG: hypothetical protein ABGY42_08690, partial [bacterium]